MLSALPQTNSARKNQICLNAGFWGCYGDNGKVKFAEQWRLKRNKPVNLIKCKLSTLNPFFG